MENIFSKVGGSIATSLNPVSFAEGIFDASVQTPWNAIAQLTNNALPQMKLVGESDESLARTVGSIAGAAIDMTLLGKVTSKISAPLFLGINGAAKTSASLGMDGMLYGGLLTPSDKSKSLLEGRMENAFTSGLTFASMGGANHYLDGKAVLGPESVSGLKSGHTSASVSEPKSIAGAALRGIVSGSIGGLTSSLAQVALSDRKLSRDDLASSTLKMAAFGGMFGAIGGARGIGASEIPGRLELPEKSQSPEKSENSTQSFPSSKEMAQRAADRVLKWHEQIDSRIGFHLAEPNVVLTLADARGQTEFYVHRPQPGDQEAVQRLDLLTKKDGIRLYASEVDTRLGRALIVNVHSNAGTEKVAAATKLPGIAPFENTSEHAYSLWFGESVRGVQQAIDEGKYPPNVEAIHVTFGVAKGYPDEAIASLETPRREQLTTYVPFSDYYPCAEPNYNYLADSAHIVGRHVEEWGKILEHFYNSPEHVSLRKHPGFAAAARVELERSRELFNRSLTDSPRLVEFDFPDQIERF